jgi:ferritin-like metal-binding protein YciE
MPAKSTKVTEVLAAEPVAILPVTTRSAARATRGRKKVAKTPATKTRAKSTNKVAKPKKPAPARAQESATGTKELAGARRELAEVTTACREAQSRLAALRADAERSATEVRGITKAAERSREQTEQVEEAVARLAKELAEVRSQFAVPEVTSTVPAEKPSPLPDEMDEAAAELPELPGVPALPADERADDLRDRLVRLLSDAWGVEKEQVDLLQTLADDCGDRELRVLLEAHRADSQERQQAVAGRLEVFGTSPAGGRGLLGQFVTRIWDAVQSPRDQADRALLAVLKALSTAEFQAGLYAALHAGARFAGDDATADLAAECFRQERDRAGQLRAALVPTVGRAVRR